MATTKHFGRHLFFVGRDASIPWSIGRHDAEDEPIGDITAWTFYFVVFRQDQRVYGEVLAGTHVVDDGPGALVTTSWTDTASADIEPGLYDYEFGRNEAGSFMPFAAGTIWFERSSGVVAA